MIALRKRVAEVDPLPRKVLRKSPHPLKRGKSPPLPPPTNFQQAKKTQRKKRIVIVNLSLQRVNINQKRQQIEVKGGHFKNEGGVTMICHQTKTAPLQVKNGARKRKEKVAEGKRNYPTLMRLHFRQIQIQNPKVKGPKNNRQLVTQNL